MLPDDPATENQISYLQSLGYPSTSGLTKQEASSIIDNILKKRQPADANVFRLASDNKVETTPFDSKNTIYWKIFQHQMSKSDYDLACWYVFRVYRSCINKSEPGGIYEIYHPIFTEISHSILSHPPLLASLKRNASNSKNGFRWFGSFTADGYQIQGESTRTQLYLYTINELKQKFPTIFQKSVQNKPNYLEQNSQAAPITSEIESKKGGTNYIYPLLFFVFVFFLIRWLSA